MSPLSCWICYFWLAVQVASALLACPSNTVLFGCDVNCSGELTRQADTVGLSYDCSTLNFDNNGYESVSANAFAGMPEINYILLRDNQITALPPGLFTGTPKLLSLHLGGNGITALPPGLFDGSSKLLYLFLERNHITALPSGLFSNTASLIFLYLAGNPLQCCDISGLLSLTDGYWPAGGVTCSLNGTKHTLSSATALLDLYPSTCACSDAPNCAVQGTACVSEQTFKQCSTCSTGFYLNATSGVCSVSSSQAASASSSTNAGIFLVGA